MADFFLLFLSLSLVCEGVDLEKKTRKRGQVDLDHVLISVGVACVLVLAALLSLFVARKHGYFNKEQRFFCKLCCLLTQRACDTRLYVQRMLQQHAV